MGDGRSSGREVVCRLERAPTPLAAFCSRHHAVLRLPPPHAACREPGGAAHGCGGAQGAVYAGPVSPEAGRPRKKAPVSWLLLARLHHTCTHPLLSARCFVMRTPWFVTL